MWQVNEEGSFVDGLKVSTTSLEELNLREQRVISVKIGVQDDAEHVGGINIFGNRFGNYPQDIVLRIRYH